MLLVLFALEPNKKCNRENERDLDCIVRQRNLVHGTYRCSKQYLSCGLLEENVRPDSKSRIHSSLRCMSEKRVKRTRCVETTHVGFESRAASARNFRADKSVLTIMRRHSILNGLSMRTASSD